MPGCSGFCAKCRFIDVAQKKGGSRKKFRGGFARKRAAFSLAGGFLRSRSTAISFCLAGRLFKGQVNGHVVLPGRRLLRSRSKAISFCLAGRLLKGQVNGYVVLPGWRLLRSRSKAISFCLKAARAGPAVAPALHPRYPANTIARQRRVPSAKAFS